MNNKYFPDEAITFDDLYFTCYMIERVSRKLMQRNAYAVNKIGRENMYHLISCAGTLHSLNPLQVESDWISEYHLEHGNFDITDVDRNLCTEIPSETQIGKVYARLIDSVTSDYVAGISDVYNSPVCETIDNYNSSAYYEPSYVITKAYLSGGF
ncbi:MAG: hypothetical protein K6G18_16305 [Treponema sp.]|nr:hypothetical protein [Treponema sp.]MCR5623403.1 hypothetical protein [Treponema sp.]